jgi:membrane associated rhomboid family serine protease
MNGFLDDFKNTWHKPNNGLARLIIINVFIWVFLNLVFFISRVSGSPGLYDGIMVNIMLPPNIVTFFMKPWTLITYFFTHQDFFHILFNMLFIYWFGKLLQDSLGTRKLVSVYVWGGIAGGLSYLILFNTIPFFIEKAGSGMIGASAGVYAIVVATATLMPDHRIFLLLFGPVKIKYIAAVYIFLSFLGTIQANAGGNVAHLAGALMGFLFIYQMRNGSDLSRPVYNVIDFFADLFKSKPKVKVSHSSKTTVKGASMGKLDKNAPKQADIDAILDKISEYGYEKLTAEEKQILFRASQKKE